MNWYRNASVRECLVDVSKMAVDLAIAFGIKASDPAPKNPFNLDRSTNYHQPKEDPTRDSQ